MNLYLGMPYKEKGSRPKIEKVMALKGEYMDGKSVPDGVLFLTAAVDVQRGSAMDPSNPPRLEIEICGHGAQFRTWSLAYRWFEGSTIDGAFEGAWAEMHKWAQEGGLVMTRSDGMRFPVALALIDSGDGKYNDIVYSFSRRWQNTMPVKGANVLVKRKDEKGDEAGPMNFKRYRIARSDKSADVSFVECSTNYYKGQVYTNLNVARQDFDPQRPGFCDFPRDRSEKYFLGLTAEERRNDGSFHNPSNRRNEPLDLRVYNLCAADVYLAGRVAAARVAAKAAGASDLEILKIDHNAILDLLTRQTARRVLG